jgi:hypothetical protein
MKPRVVALTAAVLFWAAAPASAQTSAPSLPALPALPPAVQAIVSKALQSLAGNAAAPYALDPNHVRGVVTYFKRFDLQLRMPLDQYRDVHLHPGTVIDPRGASLQTGNVVDVKGHAASDGSLDADTITLVRQ